MKHIDKPGHRPGRKSHRVLARLAQGRATIKGLQDAAGVDLGTADGRRFSFLIDSMRHEHLIGSGRPKGMYHITAEGRDVLRRLDAGEVVAMSPAPSVRIFAREIAA